MDAIPLDQPPTPDDTAPTWYLDADDPSVAGFAREATEGLDTDVERASALFAAVRDQIRYDPYVVDLRPEVMRASTVLASGRNWCVPKSTLLTAACRAVGLPARVGFADVRNHLATDKLLALMGTDLFMWHGYTAMWLDGAWRKATPAFNTELCARFGVPPLEFDGYSDALLHAHDGTGARYMEYVTDRGVFEDLPFEDITHDLQTNYTDGLLDTVEQRVADEGFH